VAEGHNVMGMLLRAVTRYAVIVALLLVPVVELGAQLPGLPGLPGLPAPAAPAAPAKPAAAKPAAAPAPAAKPAAAPAAAATKPAAAPTAAAEPAKPRGLAGKLLTLPKLDDRSIREVVAALIAKFELENG